MSTEPDKPTSEPPKEQPKERPHIGVEIEKRGHDPRDLEHKGRESGG